MSGSSRVSAKCARILSSITCRTTAVIGSRTITPRAAFIALRGQLDENATGDAVARGVGLVLFWPALLFMEGDGPEAQEYAHLKGEYEALQQTAIQKKCGAPTTVTAAATAAPAPTAAETAAAAAVEPAAGPSMEAAPQQAVVQQATISPAELTAVASQWRGEGVRDGCGKPYVVTVAMDADRYVKGSVQRDGIVYLVNGKADPSGKLDDSLADLSDPAAAATAPKHVTVDLQFGPELTTGGFSTFDGAKFDCTTAVTLQRTTS
jgi:hypothetical protein